MEKSIIYQAPDFGRNIYFSLTREERSEAESQRRADRAGQPDVRAKLVDSVGVFRGSWGTTVTTVRATHVPRYTTWHPHTALLVTHYF